METLIAGAGAVLIGIFSGRAITLKQGGKKELQFHEHSEYNELINRVSDIEQIIPSLIPRAEVQDAINKVPPLVMDAVRTEMNGIGLAMNQRPAPSASPGGVDLAQVKADTEKMKQLNAMLKNFEQAQGNV